MNACIVCDSSMEVGVVDWIKDCSNCRLRKATVSNGDSEYEYTIGWDDDNARALDSIRNSVADKVISALEQFNPLSGLQLLDVGCGPGWFLRAAAKRGAIVTGIEPDTRLAQAARDDGLVCHNGFFPDALPDDPFNIIVFNDVFEHLPDPAMAVKAIHRSLSNNGIVLVNLPVADGILYRTAEILGRLGITFPLKRLWQCGYESPHLYYFQSENLTQMFERDGFERIYSGNLPSVDATGLWGRIRESDRIGVPASIASYLFVITLIPILRLMPADIGVVIYRKTQ